MSLVSNAFLIFVLTAVVLYYLIPGRYQWILLLLSGYVYYLSGNASCLVYILFSTLVTYMAALLIESRQKAGKPGGQQKAALCIGLILNFGMLFSVKYLGFITGNLNQLFHLEIPGISILLPLGISFYTFQTSGYLLDVYWNKIEPEKNLLKFSLFVSFFPQLLQGPIGRYDRLAPQLTQPHQLDWNHIARGVERMIYGFCKKLIIADWAAVFTDAIWGNLDKYNGLALFGLLFYGIQLYADFSGAMDVVLGVAELFGIHLDENFRRPYLAVSMADYWKRWHITLGEWMMDYIFYPVSLSKFMKWLSGHTRRIFGKKTGRLVPTALCDLIVFFFVGIWHGASWKYVFYGFLNGGIIAFSVLMGNQYRKWKKALHISGSEAWYHVFCIVRTFIIVNLRWFLDRSEDMKQGFRVLKLAFTRFSPAQLFLIPAGREGKAFTLPALAIICAGCIIMLALGIIEEKGIDIRSRINSLRFPVAAAICFLLFLMIGLFGCTAAPRGFIYAQF